MKYLIIPDIHNNFVKAEEIIKLEKPDKTILLGDNFDSWGQTIDDVNNTSLWLKESLENTDRIHLIGNHDLAYMTDNESLRFAGFNKNNLMVVRKHDIDWRKMKFYYWIDNWLCTHAGLSNSYYSKCFTNETIKEWINKESSDAFNALKENKSHRMFNVGRGRGGLASYSGILWCDYHEFEDVPQVKQIFGHTQDRDVRRQYSLKWKSEHICLDTGLNHYAVYDNQGFGVYEDSMQVKESP